VFAEVLPEVRSSRGAGEGLRPIINESASFVYVLKCHELYNITSFIVPVRFAGNLTYVSNLQNLRHSSVHLLGHLDDLGLGSADVLVLSVHWEAIVTFEVEAILFVVLVDCDHMVTLNVYDHHVLGGTLACLSYHHLFWVRIGGLVTLACHHMVFDTEIWLFLCREGYIYR